MKTQTKYYNRKHLSYHFKVENLVKLFIKNLKLKQSSKKLSSKFADSFRVEELVRSQAYRLSLFQLYNKIHSIFHVSYLKPYFRRKDDNSILKLILSKLIDDEEQYEIEEIIERQKRKNEL